MSEIYIYVYKRLPYGWYRCSLLQVAMLGFHAGFQGYFGPVHTCTILFKNKQLAATEPPPVIHHSNVVANHVGVSEKSHGLSIVPSKKYINVSNASCFSVYANFKHIHIYIYKIYIYIIYIYIIYNIIYIIYIYIYTIIYLDILKLPDSPRFIQVLCLTIEFMWVKNVMGPHKYIGIYRWYVYRSQSWVGKL